MIILVLVIVLIAYLLKKPSPLEPRKSDEAMEILRKRYASGEITPEEFSQKKKDLQA